MENGDEEEEEEGMIREDEEGMIREDEEMRGSSSRRHRRKDYDSESEEYRNKKRRKVGPLVCVYFGEMMTYVSFSAETFI